MATLLFKALHKKKKKTIIINKNQQLQELNFGRNYDSWRTHAITKN